MDALFILAVVGLTSTAALLFFRRGGRRGLGAAAGKALESAGLAVVFFLLNLGVGVCLALALRRAPGAFVSLYVNDDVSVLVLSVLQALVLQWWREPESRDPAGS
jgi:hypothetical protein